MASNTARIIDDTEVLSEEGRWRKVEKSSITSKLKFWFLAFFFGFILIVMIGEQFQIYAMQGELDNLKEFHEPNTIDDYELFEDNTPDNATDGTIQALHSRQRRHSHMSRLVPLVHLHGKAEDVSRVFRWQESTQPTYSTSNGNHGIELVERNGAIQAIRVLCSGWYYVYAQIPYQQTDYHVATIGHHIVRMETCGRSPEEIVLRTSFYLDSRTLTSIPNNCGYLGGIVYLSESSHVEVRPNDDAHTLFDNDARNMHENTFFGLHLIRHHDPPECRQLC